MKKVLSTLLAVIMMLSLNIPAFAADLPAEEGNSVTNITPHQVIHNAKIATETGKSNVSTTVKILSDLNGNQFELIELGEQGYMVFDAESGKYLEEALESPSPYLGLSDNLYYFGPLNYYQLIDGKFIHTIFPDKYEISYDESLSVQSAFDTALQRSRLQKDTEMLALMKLNPNSATSCDRIQARISAQSAKATNEYIPDYSYIKDAVYPPNKDGTCGYTAACLILNYWHNVEGNVIDSAFLDSKGDLLTGSDDYTLQDKLLSYGDSTSSWGLTIRDILIDYCNEYGIAATSTYYITNFDIFAEIDRGRPVIVFGYFPNDPTPVTRGKVFHAVTAYGTSTNGTLSKLIVHYGWNGYNHVILDGGLVGSSTQFVLN